MSHSVGKGIAPCWFSRLHALRGPGGECVRTMTGGEWLLLLLAMARQATRSWKPDMNPHGRLISARQACSLSAVLPANWPSFKIRGTRLGLDTLALRLVLAISRLCIAHPQCLGCASARGGHLVTNAGSRFVGSIGRSLRSCDQSSAITLQGGLRSFVATRWIGHSGQLRESPKNCG